MSIPCGISAILGSKYLNEYINRTKKSAFLLILVCYFMIISLIILLFSSISKVIEDKNKGNPILGFDNYC